MPAWLHRTTKKYLRSVPEADLPEAVANYIEEPDLSAVTGEPTQYWVVVGDTVSLMDQVAKDIVDAEEVIAKNDQSAAEASALVDVRQRDGAVIRQLIESLTKTHNKLANRIREVERALNDMKDTSGGADNIRAAIPLPSSEVISEGPAPATFTNLQNRSKATEIADFKADLAAGDQDV